MTDSTTKLQVLLVEDEPDDLKQYIRDLPAIFTQFGVGVEIHPCADFDEAFTRTSNPLHRYDLIVSDTYSGPARNGDAQVLKMVRQYRGSRFCPLVVYSSSVKPPALEESAFVVWADKATSADIERAIGQLLEIRIPQLARKLHEQIDRAAGSYLWGFLEENWTELNKPAQLSSDVLERIIRRRAAVQIGDMDPISDSAGVFDRDAPEYYIYPAFSQENYNLGDILRAKAGNDDWRVVLTPHCHLYKQPGQGRPRADHVLLVQAFSALDVLGETLVNTRAAEEPKKQKKLTAWARSPANTGGKPEGRHWYLPAFLEIPHMFCDFLRIESVPHDRLAEEFERIATLVSPHAEALQSSFSSFYSSVGIPNMRVESIKDMLS